MSAIDDRLQELAESTRPEGRIVAAIWRDLQARSGMDPRELGVDDDILREILDTWVELTRDVLDVVRT